MQSRRLFLRRISIRILSLGDDERVPTPRRVQIAEQPKRFNDDVITSEEESISTAIDVAEENEYDNASFEEPTSQSAVEKIFANMILNNEAILFANGRQKLSATPKSEKNVASSGSLSSTDIRRERRRRGQSNRGSLGGSQCCQLF